MNNPRKLRQLMGTPAEEMIHQIEKDLEKMRESIEEEIKEIEGLMEGGEE
jgi:uncharacterized protein YPO0396